MDSEDPDPDLLTTRIHNTYVYPIEYLPASVLEQDVILITVRRCREA